MPFNVNWPKATEAFPEWYFRKWNREGSDKIIRIQDKSARLAIDSKERILQETERTLSDGRLLKKKKTIQRKMI